jgi:Fe2+ transport system protein FeoA
MSSAADAPSSTIIPAEAGEDPAPLSRLAVGQPHTVLRVDGPERAELAREGVQAGAVVVVAARTPLGGPIVVQVGGARVAMSSRVASQVLMRRITPADGRVP